jgi:hypothetical protein
MKDYSAIPDKTAPGPVDKVTWDPTPGGVVFHYTLPTDEDLMCVKAVYTDDNGKLWEVRASWYAESLTITGFGNTEPKSIKLIAVDNSNNESVPVEWIVTPGEPNIFAIAESVEILPYFGGVQFLWDNPTRKDIAVEMYIKDFTNTYVPCDVFYSNAERGSGINFSGLESVPTDFAIYVRDRWGNKSPVKYFRETPDPYLMVPNLGGKGSFLVEQFNTDTRLRTLNQLTYETWFKVNKFSTIAPYISGIIGAESGSDCILIRLGNGSLANNNKVNVGGFPDILISEPFFENVWYHIALVYDGATVKFYVDGNEVVSKNVAGKIVDLSISHVSDGAFAIGQSLGSRFFDGELRETRVWSIARTPEEINNYRCDVDPSTLGLVAYWRFNDGEGVVVKDYSPNKYDIQSKAPFTWDMVPGCGYSGN